MGDGTVPMTRALSSTNFSDGDASFVSLFEANRAKVMDALTPEQLDSIINDEDELEFCPADSVIADMQFAQLLNAEREIQVGQTVYRYMPNGVASTSEEHAGELKAASSLASGLQVTPENVGTTVKLTPNVDFTLVPYEPQMFSEEYLYGRGPGTYGRYPGNGSGGGNTSDGNSGNTSGSGSDNTSGGGSDNASGSNSGSEDNITASSTSSGIELSNGVVIPLSDIREVDYSEKGDGNWFHRTWTGFFGRNVVAI